MSYRGRLLAAVLLASSGPVGGQDEEFPIGAWFPGGLSDVFPHPNSPRSTQWAALLDTVRATGFNTIHAAHTTTRAARTAAFNQQWMALAHARDLNVQLHSWQQPPRWRNHSENYWTRTFEAEDADLFTYPIGRQVTDGDRVARYAEMGVGPDPGDAPGLLLDSGPTAHVRLRLRRNASGRFGYHDFWLKTDNNSGTAHIATLRVLHPDPAAPSGWTVMDSTIVRESRFRQANTYQHFPLEYDIGLGSGAVPVRYQVDWTGTGNLWVDHIRAHDWEINSATGGRVRPPNAARLFRGGHDAAIRDTLAAYYGGTVAPPWRFALYDEPRWELRESVAYVDSLIRDQTDGLADGMATGPRGVSPYNVANRQGMQRYVDTVDPSELLVDFYRIFAGTPPGGDLNSLVTDYGIARDVSQRAKGGEGIPLWCVVQVHNWGTGWRTPTPEEIRVQVNLALAHGATGIYYFLHHAYFAPRQRNPQGGLGQVIDGLVDRAGNRTPRLTEVEDLNAMLNALDDTYLALTSDAVFSGDDPDDFVQGLSDERDSDPDDFFLGTFTHTDDARYLMVVNQQCAPGDTLAVTVTLDVDEVDEDLDAAAARALVYEMLDVYGETRTAAAAVTGHDDRVSFPVTLEPGGGRLYRIESMRPDDPGEVALSWEGGKVTATLDDEDEPKQKRNRDRQWQWQRRPEDNSTEWAPIDGAESSTYRPVRADDGHRLRVRVSYIERTRVDANDRKTATSPETEVVRLPRVSFAAASYTTVEGGRPIGAEADPVWARITVQVSAAENARIEIPIPSVRIPITVTPVGETDTTDYRVRGLPKANRLRLSASEPGVFTIEGLREADLADETVQLGFGELPAAVVAGATTTATVTIHDTPNKPVDLTASPGGGQVTLQWAEPPPDSGIDGWQYRTGQGKQWGDWMPLDPATLKVTVPELTNGVMYRFRVRAFNQHGYGEVATTTATPNDLQATAYRGAVVLTWADGGRTDVTRWEYQVRRSSKKKWGGWQAARVDASPQTETVRNLTNGKAYDFQVQGLTAAGEVAVPPGRQ